MNKNKVKNIALGVSLGLNVLLGFFLGGGLISSCTAKKAENPVSSVSADASGEIIDGLHKRVLNALLTNADDLDPLDYPNIWEGSGLNYSFVTGCVLGGTGTPHQYFCEFGHGMGRVEFNQIKTAGLYYGAFQHAGSSWGGGYTIDRANYERIFRASATFRDGTYQEEIRSSGNFFYVTQEEVDAGCYVAISSNYDFTPYIYLIAYADIPAKVTLDLGAEWSPIAWLSNRASENYALLTTSFDDPQNTMFRLGFDGLIFSTLNDDRYFDALRVTYRPLWQGARYIYGGETLSYNYDNNAEFRLALATGVEYRDLNTGNWFNVANSRLNMLNPSSPVFTASLDWVSPQYRTVRFWAYPTATLLAPSIQDVTYNSGVSWSNYGRAPTRYGLDFFGWLGLDPYGYVETNAGVGDAFTLLSGAFSAVGGILNIQILPFLTLGTLIFVPLVVLIILAILRLLAK